MSAVTLARDGGIATVTVDAPPVNAMGHEVLAGLERAGRELTDDGDVRSVVLTGAGIKAFMAGADIGEFAELRRGGPEAIAQHLRWTSEIFATWATLPQPVIAAVQANALGGGLEMALVCDLIVLDAGARVGLPEVKLGLIPGGGGTQRLAARVGRAAAKRMIMLGSALTADQALGAGLVDVVAGAGTAPAEATALAERLAALPAVAVQGVKRAIDTPAQELLGTGLRIERREFQSAFGSEDFAEGYAAFLEKRRPVFRHA